LEVETVRKYAREWVERYPRAGENQLLEFLGKGIG